MPLSKSEIKLIRSLRLKKYRYQHHLFVAEGKKLVEDLLFSNALPYKLLSTDETDSQTYQYISPKDMASISLLEAPSTHLGVFHIPAEVHIEQLQPKQFFALHALQDPGNLGTIIRSMDWFGPVPVVILPGTTDPFSPKVVQASMGSIYRVPIIRCRPDELLKYLKKENISLLAAHMTGHPIDQFTVPARFCLVIGNEGKGLTDFPLLPDFLVSIPPSPLSKAESLNASVSAGILAYRLFGSGSRDILTV